MEEQCVLGIQFLSANIVSRFSSFSFMPIKVAFVLEAYFFTRVLFLPNAFHYYINTGELIRCLSHVVKCRHFNMIVHFVPPSIIAWTINAVAHLVLKITFVHKSQKTWQNCIISSINVPFLSLASVCDISVMYTLQS